MLWAEIQTGEVPVWEDLEDKLSWKIPKLCFAHRHGMIILIVRPENHISLWWVPKKISDISDGTKSIDKKVFLTL